MNFLKLVKTWFSLLFKPQSCLTVILGIFLIQFVGAENWLKFKIGDFNNFGWFIAALIWILCLDWIYNSKVYRLCNVNSLTELDIFLWDIFLIAGINWFIFHQKGMANSADIIFWMFIFSFTSLCGIIMRFCYILYYQYSNLSSRVKLYDLQTLLEKPVSNPGNGRPILVDERPSENDIFKRSNTISQIKNSITIFSFKHSYVIGLIGNWGVGKTTLLNLVKKSITQDEKSNSIFVNAPGNKDQSFDLWLFGSQDQLIKGLYDTFMYNLNGNYNPSIGNNILKNGSQVLTDIPQIGNIFKAFASGFGSYYDINQIKIKLTNLIESSGKHYVVCIENLDRANEKQVILLLKLINTIFNLPYVTYVLLYDKDRLKEIMEGTNELNTDFADKVINQEIEVPTMLDENVCLTILGNLLVSYGISESEIINKFNYVLRPMVHNLNSIRDLKRIINSTFTVLAIKDKLRLNLPQVLAIQYIQFANKKLYEEIRRHKDFFIFTDNQIVDTKDGSEKELFINTGDKKYFSKILSNNNSEYIELLSALFLKVEMAEYEDDSVVVQKQDFNKALHEASISTQKYFYNYFLLSENNYVQINAETRNFIRNVNDEKDINKIWNKYIVNKSSSEKEDYSLELTLFVTSEDIKSTTKREKLAEVMWHSIRDHYRDEYWNSLSSQRIIQCIIDLISEISDDDINTFNNVISGYYNSLDIIREMKNEMKVKSTRIFNKLNKLYCEMCDEILGMKKKINLYNSKYYVRKNILGLVYYPNHQSEVKEYIAKYINSQTIYKVLQDAIDYTGKNSKEIIGGLFAEIFKENKSEIEKALKDALPETEKEKAIFDKYKEFSKLVNSKQNTDDISDGFKELDLK